MYLKGKQKWVPYLFILPWLIGLLVFVAFPMIFSLGMSLFDWDIVGDRIFIGLKNYIDMFHDELFYHSLKVTFQYAVILVPLNVGLALALALLLNKPLKCLGAFKTIFYLPSVLSGVALALIWGWILNDRGILNYLLSLFHIKAVPWLKDPDVAVWSMVLTTAWALGSMMMVFLSGLKEIPEQVIEAARIDGAGEFTIFSKLVIPMAKPALTTVAIFAFIRSWNDFLGPLVFLGKDELYTLSLAASMLKSNLDPNWSLLLALGAVMILPVLILFFVMQKYFIQGIAMSGIKG